MKRTLCVAAAALALAAASSAQFSTVPGSGCPGGRAITTTGTPQIGLLVTYTWFCSARSDAPFLLFGPALPPIFSLPVPPACTAGCFLIHPNPPIFLVGTAGTGLVVPITIPMDPALIGQTVHTQGACLTTTACAYLGLGTATQIQ